MLHTAEFEFPSRRHKGGCVDRNYYTGITRRLGMLVRARRRERGLSCEQLARKVKYAEQTIRSMESGYGSLTGPAWGKVFRYLKIKPDVEISRIVREPYESAMKSAIQDVQQMTQG